MKKLTVYARVTVEAFTKFVSRPFLLPVLHTVNSTSKRLQLRQRQTLVDVVAVLMSLADAENNQIGNAGKEEMTGYTHEHLRNARAIAVLGNAIPRSRWFRAIAQLKDADYLKTVCAWRFNPTDIDDQPEIRSIASNKIFTDKFFKDVGKLMSKQNHEDVAHSRAKAIKQRLSQGLSNVWGGYILFNLKRAQQKIADAIAKMPRLYPTPTPTTQ